MSYRILSCSTFIENYYICLNKKIIGFSTKVGEIGDTIFLAIKSKQGTVCGARATIYEQADIKPWKDGNRYIRCFKINKSF